MSQLAEIEALVAVVERAGFRAAAAELGVTPSAISKRVAALEQRLDARLFNRTTRRVSPTDVGRALYERARGILADLEEAEEAVVATQVTPRGRLRIGAPMDFGRRHLAELLAAFATEHPLVWLDIDLSDRFVDVVGEGFDVVIRIGSLPDSSLVARAIAPCRRAWVASPGYLEERGTPGDVAALAAHDVVGYALEAGSGHDGDTSHRANNGEMIRALVRAGHGVALLPTFLSGPDLRDGSLVELFAGEHRPTDRDLTVYAVTPHRKLLSSKVRMLLDHLRAGFGPAPVWDRA